MRFDHRALVSRWLAPASSRSAEELCDLAERGFAAVWSRTELTLGSVTLTAIADRVLVTTTEKFPAFAALKLEPSGLSSRAFRERLATVPRAELQAGFEFLLAELLIVLGSLTAEILSPALHGALLKVTVGDPPPSRSPKGSGS